MVEGYPDSLGGWSAPAIFKEGGRLLSKYIALLYPFILAFYLPAVVIQFLETLGISWLISHHKHHPHPHPHPHPHHHHFLGHLTGHFPHHHHHHQFGSFQSFFASNKVSEGAGYGAYVTEYAPAPAPGPSPPHHHHHHLYLVLIFLAVAIVFWLLASLAIAALSKAVAYIYSNSEEDPSASKSIFKSLPGALFRLFITALWVILITAVAVFIVSLPFHVLTWIFKEKLNHRIVRIVNVVSVYIVLLLLGFFFLLAKEIAVLEPANYGLAALRRSGHLVQAKLPAALIFFLANIIVAGVFGKATRAAIFFPSIGKLPYWTVYIFAVLLALLFLVYWVYFSLVSIVLYFATKLKFDAEHQYLPVQSGDDNPYTPLVVPAENN